MYKQRFFKTQETSLTITNLSWSGRGMCGAACTLQPEMQKLHCGRTAPQVSLSKEPKTRWMAVGEFVTRCEQARDWKEYMTGVQHSQSLHAFVTRLNWVTRGTPGVHLSGSSKEP